MSIHEHISSGSSLIALLSKDLKDFILFDLGDVSVIKFVPVAILKGLDISIVVASVSLSCVNEYAIQFIHVVTLL